MRVIAIIIFFIPNKAEGNGDIEGLQSGKKVGVAWWKRLLIWCNNEKIWFASELYPSCMQALNLSIIFVILIILVTWNWPHPSLLIIKVFFFFYHFCCNICCNIFLIVFLNGLILLLKRDSIYIKAILLVKDKLESVGSSICGIQLISFRLIFQVLKCI